MRSKPSPKARRSDTTAEAVPPEVADLLAQGTVDAATRLSDLANNEDRAISKAARRALYTLKQAGIEPPAGMAPPTPSPAVAPSPAIQRALLTNVDGYGGQMLVFLQEDAFGGSPWMLTFLVSYATGLEDLGGRKMPRREVESALREMREKENRLAVDAPIDYARHLLQESVERRRARSRPLPEGYTEIAQRVGLPTRTYPRPLVYEYYDPETVRADLSISHAPERLFEHSLFRSWLLDMKAARPWVERFVQSQQTRLVLPPHQLRQLADRVSEQAADALLGERGVADYRRRLEETALVLHLDNHPEDAKQALYQALTLEAGLPPHAVAFTRYLTRRTLEVLVALDREHEEEEKVEPETPGLLYRV